MFRVLKSIIKTQPESGNFSKKSIPFLAEDLADVLQQIENNFHNGNLDDAGKMCRQVLGFDQKIAKAWYYRGLIAYHQGRGSEALDCLYKANACDPDWAEACNHYGNALREHGRLDEAIEMYDRAQSLRNDYAAPHYNIGLVWQTRACYAEAEQSFQRALEVDPDLVAARNSLALLLLNQGKTSEAAVHFSETLRRTPDNLVALNNLGIALLALKKADEALVVCRRAVEIAPASAEVHNTLGMALKEVGLIQEAEAHYRDAIALNPEFPELYNNLGIVLRITGRLDEAEQACRRALSLNPAYVEAHINLGNTLKEQKRTSEASTALEKALELRADDAIAWNNLGLVRKDQFNMAGAVDCYRRAINFQPDYADAISNLGGALYGQGKIEDAVATFRSVFAVDALHFAAHSNMLFTMQYSSHYSEETIYSESRRWDERFGTVLRFDHKNVPVIDRRLRVGYVSSDFRRHSVSYFLMELFKHHSKIEVSVVCYSDVLSSDDHTEIFRAQADCWRNIAGLNNESVAELVRDDGIDILVDLAGHTGERLPLFARKPAPIQVTWLGYPGTTGLSAMDYRISDDIADPVGKSDRFHSEKICRLPGGFLCYTPPSDAPAVVSAPCLSAGYITFGSFNNLAKITPEVVELWSKLLCRIPDARLIIKNQSLADVATRTRYSEIICSFGVSPERFEMRPWEPSRVSHLSVYGEIDIALDTFPYNGTTTTCESLWMGVPVVTIIGERHVARVGASILSRVGLSDLAAKTPDAYINIAEKLARDSIRLGSIRSSLRYTMLSSSLCNGTDFATSVENAYRRMWREWCAPQI